MNVFVMKRIYFTGGVDMRWLYMFAVIFLMIFGMASLVHVLVRALLDGGSRKYDIYVKDDEFIDDFIENARKSSFIGRIYIIKKDGSVREYMPYGVNDGRQLCDDNGKR